MLEVTECGPPPCGCGYKFGDVDRFRVDGGEDPRRAESSLLTTAGYQALGAEFPTPSSFSPFVGAVVPKVPADQESREDSIESCVCAVAALQS